MVAFLLHWFWVGIGTICALAFLGILGAGSDVVMAPPDSGKPNNKNPIIRGISEFWTLVFSGAFLAICLLVLAIPTIFFKFALGWKWEDSFLPGVFLGIALAIVASIIATDRHDKKVAREKQPSEDAPDLKLERDDEE